MSVLAFLARELAPSQRRYIEASRTAIKTAATTGIAAAAQTLGPFGALFAFRIGQPGISLGLFEGGLIIFVAAAMQAAIVPITGKLLDYPGLIMTFLFVVFAAVGYLLSNTRFFLILALVAVGTITTVYVGIFEPGTIGWGSTYTFDGILIASIVMVAIDAWIWPSPPEPKLLEAIAADFDRSRRRLRIVGRHYLEPAAEPLPPTQLVSRLAPNLASLKSVEEHQHSAPGRLARLLDAVAGSERLFLEIERLAVVANEPASDEISQSDRDQLELALSLLDSAFDARIEQLRAGLVDSAGPRPPLSDFHQTITYLKDADGSATIPASMGLRKSNLGRFVRALETIGNLLEPALVGGAAGEVVATDDLPEPQNVFDRDRFRFSVKLGATMVLGLLVGLTTQRADLQTILWSIAVAASPNQYGGVLRKTFLRIAGCVMGGLATLAAMHLVSQNFDSLPPYVIAIFVVSWLSAYLAQSSDWLNYAGIQMGITFLICFVSLGPSTDVYRPLWRFWGIMLGILTTGFVFLTFWPEYARDKLIASLARLMRTALTFAEEVADGAITPGRLASMERRLSTNLLAVLSFADQARLEGRRGRTTSASGVEAAATVIRIAYRFQIIARARLSGSQAVLPRELLERRLAWEQSFCTALGSRSEWLESNFSASPQSSTIPIEGATRDLPLAPFFESGDPSDQQESYVRLPLLLETLDAALSNLMA